VQPLLSEQWFVRMEALARPALDAVRAGQVRFHPKTWESTYFHWMENIRDWAISRQLWWGHRIPAWRCGGCGEWTVALEDPTHCAHCGSTAIVQEEDVLDTWFSSALWPFSTLGWPDDTPELRLFYPTDVLSTAADILFFWVARMIMMGLHFTGQVPFRDVYLHPLVRDEQGRKMSKSKGIGVDPLDVMEVYGADAMRWTLTSLAAQGRDVRFGLSVVEGGQRFVTKLWNAARFALLNLGDAAASPAAAAPSLYERWIRHRMDVAIAEARASLEAFRFNDAAAALYHFVWDELCDWYIELAKLSLGGAGAGAGDGAAGADPATRAATQQTLVSVLRGALLALHPVMPFVTDEIAASLPDADGRFLMEGRYPEPGPPLAADEAREMDTLVELVGRIRQVRGELDLAPQTQIRVTFPGAARAFVSRHAPAIRALARAAEPAFSDAPPSPTASVVRVQGWSVHVELDDPKLLADEVRRLEKALSKLEKDLRFVSEKLENPRFSERAKPEVVAAERTRHARLDEEAAAVRARLERLRRAAGDGA
jgi:valyl-tRNA synthetase